MTMWWWVMWYEMTRWDEIGHVVGRAHLVAKEIQQGIEQRRKIRLGRRLQLCGEGSNDLAGTLTAGSGCLALVGHGGTQIGDQVGGCQRRVDVLRRQRGSNGLSRCLAHSSIGSSGGTRDVRSEVSGDNSRHRWWMENEHVSVT